MENPGREGGLETYVFWKTHHIAKSLDRRANRSTGVLCARCCGCKRGSREKQTGREPVIATSGMHHLGEMSVRGQQRVAFDGRDDGLGGARSVKHAGA